MPSKLLAEVADYCWSNNFLSVFRNFFTDHASEFEDAPAMHDGEHNLAYYNLFQVYLRLYEESLETYLKTLDVSITEFYRDVREAQNETDPYILTFIDCLLASADYDSFYKVMAKEGYKSKQKKLLAGEAKSASSSRNNLAAMGGSPDAKAEAKYSGDMVSPSGSSKAAAVYQDDDHGPAPHADGAKYSHK